MFELGKLHFVKFPADPPKASRPPSYRTKQPSWLPDASVKLGWRQIKSHIGSGYYIVTDAGSAANLNLVGEILTPVRGERRNKFDPLTLDSCERRSQHIEDSWSNYDRLHGVDQELIGRHLNEIRDRQKLTPFQLQLRKLQEGYRAGRLQAARNTRRKTVGQLLEDCLDDTDILGRRNPGRSALKLGKAERLEVEQDQLDRYSRAVNQRRATFFSGYRQATEQQLARLWEVLTPRKPWTSLPPELTQLLEFAAKPFIFATAFSLQVMTEKPTNPEWVRVQIRSAIRAERYLSAVYIDLSAIGRAEAPPEELTLPDSGLDLGFASAYQSLWALLLRQYDRLLLAWPELGPSERRQMTGAIQAQLRQRVSGSDPLAVYRVVPSNHHYLDPNLRLQIG